MPSLRVPKVVRGLAGLSVPALVVAALPKCPFCLAALLSTVGISILPSSSTVLVASSLIICFPVGMLGTRVAGRRQRGPLILGALSALLIVAGKLPDVPLAALLLGIAGLTAAFVWRSLMATKLERAGPNAAGLVPLSGMSVDSHKGPHAGALS